MRILAAFLIILSLMGTAIAAEKVQVSEGNLNLPTYPWYDDPNPAFGVLENTIYYPYTRQDLIAKTKTNQSYRTLYLENEYLKVACIPALGGRIYSVLDKTTNEEMFHRNDEVKPALIAMRGAWISGGIEWNHGPQGHTVSVVSPVDVMTQEHADGSASLVIGNTEKMFHTRWIVVLTLHPGKAYLDEQIRIFNPTDGLHPYYFWNCTAFPNRPGTRFIYPMSLGTDHAGTTFFDWPIDNGKDLTYLKNYPTMSSVFAYECAFDFFGAYDVDKNRGLVSYANHRVVQGKKAWTWGTDDFGVVSQLSLSDAGREGAPYIEVQSGPLRTQADYGMLWPHQQVDWREYWYPVHGLGNGFEFATRDVVVQATRNSNKSLELRILATSVFPQASCVLSQGARILLDQKLDLSPAQATSVQLPDPPEGRIRVRLISGGSETLLDFETPLDIPKMTRPDLTKKLARSDGQPTADEKYGEAFLLDSQSNQDAARKAYEEVLTQDPQHVKALCGLAELDIELGQYKNAEERVRKAVARDANSGTAWYLLGVARLRQSDSTEALDCAYKTAKTPDLVGAGFDLAGRALMVKGDYPNAIQAFKQALMQAPQDTEIRNHLIAAFHTLPVYAETVRTLIADAKTTDPLDYFPHVMAALQGLEPWDQFVHDWRSSCGEQEFTLLELASKLMDLNLLSDAETLLNKAYGADQSAPLPLYYLAYVNHCMGREPQAQDYLKRAEATSCAFVFPHRVQELPILEYATASSTNGHAVLLLGYLNASLGRLDAALPLWERAVAADPSLHTAWRLLGYHAWKKQNDPKKAENYYRKAIEADTKDQVPYRDLAELLTTQNRRQEAIKLVEQMPKEPVVRYDVLLWLAEAYIAEQRFEDCITLLRTAKSSNWEGGTRPHDLFVTALVGRAKTLFDAGKYEAALADLQESLTFPANLEVGARYKLTDAETRYWMGKTLLALGKTEEAKAAWREGASQIGAKDPAHPFIPVTATQEEYVKRCATAFDLSNIKH